MDAAPWYKHRWPWLLMSGPAIVLVAGVITTWIAFASADGLVAEDYYKRGLAINKVLAREEEARRLGIEASASFQNQELKVVLRGQAPEALFVHLVHATRAGHDQRLRLAPAGAGLYQAELSALAPGRWSVAIEDPRGTWRISRGLAPR